MHPSVVPSELASATPVMQSRSVFSVSACGVACSLTAVSLVFLALSTLAAVARWRYGVEAGWVSALDLDNEKNAPALYSGLILALSAAVAWLNGRVEAVPAFVARWRVLALGLLFMAFDEVFHLHERLIGPVRTILGGGDLGYFTFAWVVPALVVLPIIVLYLAGFLLRLPADTARGFVLAGGLYLGGAIALEMVGGRYFSEHGSGLGLSMIANTEESFEMLGVCYFIFVALRHLGRARITFRVSFAS